MSSSGDPDGCDVHHIDRTKIIKYALDMTKCERCEDEVMSVNEDGECDECMEMSILDHLEGYDHADD